MPTLFSVSFSLPLFPLSLSLSHYSSISLSQSFSFCHLTSLKSSHPPFSLSLLSTSFLNSFFLSFYISLSHYLYFSPLPSLSIPTLPCSLNIFLSLSLCTSFSLLIFSCTEFSLLISSGMFVTCKRSSCLHKTPGYVANVANIW